MSMRTLILAAATAVSLIPAAASAQDWYGSYRFAQYDRDHDHDRDHDRGREDLFQRTEKLRGWMQRGAQEGWLRGDRGERAWGQFRHIREEIDRGEDRREIWQHLARLQDFVRFAHDDAVRDGYRR